MTDREINGRFFKCTSDFNEVVLEANTDDELYIPYSFKKGSSYLAFRESPTGSCEMLSDEGHLVFVSSKQLSEHFTPFQPLKITKEDIVYANRHERLKRKIKMMAMEIYRLKNNEQ